jgi:CRISPR system Cascade subunit CasE
MITFSRVRLRSGMDGSTGALVSYLARNAQDIGAAHHLVWSLFDDRGGRRPFLFRMTGSSLREDVLIYASEAPRDPHGLWEIETRAFNPTFEPDALVSFALRVNPTVARNGKRHDVIMDARTHEPELKAKDRNDVVQRVIPTWLAPRLEQAGLAALRRADGSWMMTAGNYSVNTFRHAEGHRVTLATVDVTGLATVTDPKVLAEGLLHGIGRGKSYGCGMVLVKRAG